MITNFVQGSNKNGGAGDNSCGGKSYDQAIVVAVQCTAVYIMYSLIMIIGTIAIAGQYYIVYSMQSTAKCSNYQALNVQCKMYNIYASALSTLQCTVWPFKIKYMIIEQIFIIEQIISVQICIEKISQYCTPYNYNWSVVDPVDHQAIILCMSNVQ